MLRSLLCVMLLVLAASCGSARQTEHVSPTSGLPPVGSLPAEAPRSASATQIVTGDSEFLTGGDVALGAGLANMASAAGELSWAVYQFNLSEEDELESFTVRSQGASEYWVAISDFDSGRWRALGLHELNSLHQPDAAAGSLSNGSSMYVAIIVWDGQSCVLESIELNTNSAQGSQPDNALTYGTDLLSEHWMDCSVSGADSVLATGRSDVGSSDLMFAAFDFSGSISLARRFDTGAFASSGTSVESDSSGNIIIAGEFDSLPALYKFSSSGELLWAQTVNPGTFSFMPRLAVDQTSGNIFMAGRFAGEIFNHSLICAFSPAGELLWSKTFSYDANPHSAEVQALVFMGGFLYASVRTSSDNNTFDASVIKLSGAGMLDLGVLWEAPAGASGYHTHALTPAPGGAGLGWAGSVMHSLEDADYTVVALNTNLSVLVERGFQSNFKDLRGLEIDNGGFSVMTLIGGLDGVRVARFDPAFTKTHSLELFEFSGSSAAFNIPGFDLAPSGELFLAGSMQEVPENAYWSAVELGEFTPDITAVSLLPASGDHIVALGAISGTVSDPGGSINDADPLEPDCLLISESWGD